ncbi:MAG TPA: hypothetical protein VGH54_28240 [Mycobacterium sp.]|jgi:hypothetical protein|uniref:hypothetical protein n=1 Tax=Mycobacterium sp. TaxID=1785 RepID=UPI002F42C75B
MDIYEWMTAVTAKSGFSEPAERDALALIDELRALNALGTMATLTHVSGHEPQYAGWMSRVCTICQKEH